jgi:hypothetical protein
MEEGLLHPITNTVALEWIALGVEVDVPNPPMGYVLSFMAFHERGLGIPASQFLRALPIWYRVELHNFNPNLSRRRPSLLLSARDIWVSLPIRTSGSTSSRWSTSPRWLTVEVLRRW